ncbi:hypothetical protein AB1Y20_001364 [Prymnesium parvum]|uniref:G protein-coupled receptor n=1 Tax=Prymnesium parvum TaxID=97485 RepID=A0AB34KB76_PRYPA
MLLDVLRCLRPAFYGPRFSRSLGRAVCQVAFVLLLGECYRLHSFYRANAKQFSHLSTDSMLTDLLDSIPADLEFEVRRAPSRGEHAPPELLINRATPFRMPLPRWCSSALTLLIRYMAHPDEVEELIQEALPAPEILFATERELRQLSGLEELAHFTVSEKQVYIFGIPYIYHHLTESISSAVCESTERGYRCKKRHLAALLDGKRRDPVVGAYVNAIEGAIRFLGPALLVAMVLCCTLVTLSELIISCALMVLPAYIMHHRRRALRQQLQQPEVPFSARLVLTIALYVTTPLLLLEFILTNLFKLSLHWCPTGIPPSFFQILHMLLTTNMLALHQGVPLIAWTPQRHARPEGGQGTEAAGQPARVANGERPPTNVSAGGERAVPGAASGPSDGGDGSPDANSATEGTRILTRPSVVGYDVTLNLWHRQLGSQQACYSNRQ